MAELILSYAQIALMHYAHESGPKLPLSSTSIKGKCKRTSDSIPILSSTLSTIKSISSNASSKPRSTLSSSTLPSTESSISLGLSSKASTKTSASSTKSNTSLSPKLDNNA